MDTNDGFAELLHQAEQLNSEIDNNGELPRVERSLRQILDMGQQMWNRTAQNMSKDAINVKASILLGTKGYDLPKVSQKLESLSVAKTFEPLEPIRDTDIQGFLRNERENAILSVIQETKKTTFDKIDRLHWESLECEWESEKQRILNALVGSSGEMLDVSLDTEASVADSVLLRTRSALDNVEMAYAKQVYMYNEQLINSAGIKPKLADMFLSIAPQFDDKNIFDLWVMVKHMSDVPVELGKDLLSARVSSSMQGAFIGQGRKYLEEIYIKYIKTTIASNLKQAQLGGIPGIYQMVQGFLNVRFSTPVKGLEEILVGKHHIWPLIYYCLRTGDLDAAVNAANQAGQALADFTPFLVEYAENENRRLSPNSENKLRIFYRRAVRSSTDPYKKAVFCVIGCCDVADDHREVADKVEDYLWLKLCQVQTDDSVVLDTDSSHHHQDYMTLSQLQSKLLEDYGESHFNAFRNPFLYFQVLFLTSQFEAAIDFLFRIDRLRNHAVHVAITMFEQNLLALPHMIQAPLLQKDPADRPPMRRLNFARLMMIYARKFQATDPREALQYFYFLRDLKGIQGENLFMGCVSELVLETREFEMLLGRMDKTGNRIPGLIDLFHNDTQKIIELVAADSESKGSFDDAAKLYDLAGKRDKVLELVNKLLSQVVSQPNTPQSQRERLQRMAIDIAERYKKGQRLTNRELSGTFHLLIDLMLFFDQYHANKYPEALEIIQRLRLLPFRQEEVEERVGEFRIYSDEIRKNLSDMLLATMNILYSQCKDLLTTKTGKIGPVQDEAKKEEFVAYLRSQARALITFAGMIPYRMPGDTNARLVQLEVLMN